MMQNYKLLTPGPLTTSETVKKAMFIDHCTWDSDYKGITQKIRNNILSIGNIQNDDYTTILMQGSGSFGVESVISSVFSNISKVLSLSNGVYGERIIKMLAKHNVNHVPYYVKYDETFSITEIENILLQNNFTHIIVVHCETTTGILNNIKEIGELSKKFNLTYIVDAMSSFGGIYIPISEYNIKYLISCSNKCIQGVPGFSFIIANIKELLSTKGLAKTVSLDLYDQWEEMEKNGKWRFTSPTHAVLAFYQALKELEKEGGIYARYKRYAKNNLILRTQMDKIGIKTYINSDFQSPIISTFFYPNKNIKFSDLYNYIKNRGYILYPGKLTNVDTFRIGNIGDIYEDDMYKVVKAIKDYLEEYY